LAFVNRFKVESGLKNKKQPTTQVEVKTLLNRVQPFAGFVYQSVILDKSKDGACVKVRIEAHRGIRGKCAICRKPSPGYDQLAERSWLFVPRCGDLSFVFSTSPAAWS
jgi:hypothetical protein